MLAGISFGIPLLIVIGLEVLREPNEKWHTIKLINETISVAEKRFTSMSPFLFITVARSVSTARRVLATTWPSRITKNTIKKPTLNRRGQRIHTNNSITSTAVHWYFYFPDFCPLVDEQRTNFHLCRLDIYVPVAAMFIAV